MGFGVRVMVQDLGYGGQGSRVSVLGFGVYNLLVGGVNHCSLHCRLAKFSGLRRRVKYGAAIG